MGVWTWIWDDLLDPGRRAGGRVLLLKKIVEGLEKKYVGKILRAVSHR